MRPSKLTKKLLYPTLTLLALTGIAWIISHYFMMIEGEFGPEKNQIEIWSLRIHGFTSFIALLFIGMLIEPHMISYFKHKRRLWSGLSLAVLFGCLGFSGYMLYYLSEDEWRLIFSLTHWVVGIMAVILFWTHLIIKKY